MNSLVPLPVLLPILGAGASLALLHHPRIQRWLSLAVLGSVVVVAAVLLVQADRHGPQTVWIGAWPETLGIVLVADRLAALMLLVSAIVTLAVLAYSVGQGMTEDEEGAPISVYHPTFLVLVAGVANAFLAGDLFNLFVSFEMLLFASYVLLTLGGTAARVRAGTIYVLVNLLSSTLFLISLAVTYAATGTLTLAHLAQRLAELPDHVSLMIQLLLLTTFAIKAAVFPLSLWLPDSYPTAPAPVTAVFAGRLGRQKAVGVLLTALADVDGVSLIVAGDGPERGALERRVSELGLDGRVRFLGSVPRETVLRLFRAGDASVLPSAWENFPHTVVEALAVGCPVIASAVGGVPEVVRDGENGLLVAPGDASALGDAISRFFADPGLRERLSAAAAGSVAGYSEDAVFAAIEDELERTAGR